MPALVWCVGARVNFVVCGPSLPSVPDVCYVRIGGVGLFTACLEEEDLPSASRTGLGMSGAASCPASGNPAPGCQLAALYWACASNDPTQLQAVLDSGVSPEEATQVDSNGRVRCLGVTWQGSWGPQLCNPTTRPYVIL